MRCNRVLLLLLLLILDDCRCSGKQTLTFDSCSLLLMKKKLISASREC